MEKIYNAIKDDIRNHEDINLSILGRVPKWRRSQFVILADIISDHLSVSPLLTGARKLSLGTAISPITLQRFFENEYQIKTHNDLRFIKTLDKICMFLGHADLNSYIKHKSQEKVPVQSSKIDFFEKELVVNFCQSQFDALKDLPSISFDKITQYIYKDSPLFKRIRVFIEDQKKNDLLFITENNGSNFEIFDVEKISDEPTLKVIKTKEFWNLIFKNNDDQHYIINHLNTQFYFIKKRDQQWEIWDNYNPDFGKILKIN